MVKTVFTIISFIKVYGKSNQQPICTCKVNQNNTKMYSIFPKFEKEIKSFRINAEFQKYTTTHFGSYRI